MIRMPKRMHVVAVIVALLLAALPLLHTHPLESGDAAKTPACAVCATGTGRLPLLAPTVSAPIAILYLLGATPAAGVITRSTSPRSSRAPPAA
jgi:hypothetical protein